MIRLTAVSRALRVRKRHAAAAFAAVLLIPVALQALVQAVTAPAADPPVRTGQRLAPDPDRVREAVVQVYAARLKGVRGVVADHTWIVVKPRNATAYLRYEAQGWGERSVRKTTSLTGPDRKWLGARPRLVADIRGARAQRIHERIDAVVRRYPYRRYRMWPGPNSNTFTAYVLREIRQFRVALPPTAVGKDYLGRAGLARTPSRTGWQMSLLGVAGVLVAKDEGFEITFGGLVLGIDFRDPALLLPGLGRLGLSDRPARGPLR